MLYQLSYAGGHMHDAKRLRTTIIRGNRPQRKVTRIEIQKLWTKRQRDCAGAAIFGRFYAALREKPAQNAKKRPKEIE